MSLFKPVRVAEPLDLGPSPSDTADEKSLWWRHERLHRRVLRNPATLWPRFVGERDEVEAAWLANPPTPREAFSEGDRLLDQWTAAVSGQPIHDTRPRFVRRYWAKRNRRADMHINAEGGIQKAE